MSAKHIGLGRGLNALIRDVPAPEAAAPAGPAAGGRVEIPLGQIHKNPWQPRRHFAPEALQELVESIRQRGVLQPLLVRRRPSAAGQPDTYELIAGERRFRAAQEAELAAVPAIVMDVTDHEALELALIENLQREDLNVMEEAEGYQMLADKFGLSQEQIGHRVGKGRATIANSLRLLTLPDPVKTMIAAGDVAAGHAKVLLGLEIAAEQEVLARRVAKEGLSVRQIERIVNRLKRPGRRARPSATAVPADHLRYLADRLQQQLGTSVRLSSCRTLANGKKIRGTIEIDYFSPDELDRLLVLLGVTETL
jgi:ParB family transcriptional regulator, chromosome partitioning protein